jgi:hypothetical protein
MTDKRIGNQFWKLRSKHGRDLIFKDADKLREACIEYFEWVEDNPLLEQRIFSTKEGVITGDVEKMRAMTIGGLCIFLDITHETWCEWRTSESESKKDFPEVIKWADEVIRTQKFTGAAANMLNANIIARDLGLKEAIEQSGKIKTEAVEKQEVNLDILSDEEFESYEKIVNKLADEVESRAGTETDSEC